MFFKKGINKDEYAADCIGPANSRIFPLWPFIEKICRPLLYIVSLVLLGNEYMFIKLNFILEKKILQEI